MNCDQIELAGLAALMRTQPTNMEYAATVTLPDGVGGLYDPYSHPAQQCIFEAADAGETSITIVKPVQDGGSLSSFILVLRRVHALSQSAIIAYPTLVGGRDAWTTKVWPILAAQGGVTPESGGGSRGGSSSVVTLPTGGQVMLRSAGGRHESGQASATADCLLVDETDDWPSMAALLRIEKRITKSPDPLIVNVSTVKRDGDGKDESLILRKFADGTGTRLHYPCPHCGSFFPLEFEQIDHDRQVIICPHNGCLIDEIQRLEMLKRWKRVDARRSRKFSIMWTALESPFPMVVSGIKYPILPGLIEEWRQAQEQSAINDHSFARQFYRDRLCRKYIADKVTDETGQTVIPTKNALAALSSASPYGIEVKRKDEDGDSIHLCDIPAWVEHQTIGIDVQRGGERAPGRLYFVIIGRGNGRGAITGWGTIASSPKGRQPTTAELHASLDRLDEQMRAWSPRAPIVRRGVDVGDRQDELRQWLRTRREYWAVKGTGPIKADLGDHAGWLYRRSQSGGWRLFLVETENVQRIAHGEIMRHDGEPLLSLPRGLDRQEALIRHICATVEYEPGKWSTNEKHRIHHPEFQIRHDYLDCIAYARALAYHWERTNTVQEEEPNVQPEPQRTDWMAGASADMGGSWLSG